MPMWCTRCEIHMVSTGYSMICPVCVDDIRQREIIEQSLIFDTHIIRGEN